MRFNAFFSLGFLTVFSKGTFIYGLFTANFLKNFSNGQFILEGYFLNFFYCLLVGVLLNGIFIRWYFVAFFCVEVGMNFISSSAVGVMIRIFDTVVG